MAEVLQLVGISAAFMVTMGSALLGAAFVNGGGSYVRKDVHLNYQQLLAEREGDDE